MASSNTLQSPNGLANEHDEKNGANTVQAAGDPTPAAPEDRAVTPPNAEGDENSEDGTGERPMRQKLEETSIAGIVKERPQAESGSPSRDSRDQPMASQTSQPATEDNASESSRGRLKKKRSFDDIQDDDGQAYDDDNGHRRKRSRDSKSEDDDENREQEELDQSGKLMSPKKKRSRDQFDKEHNLKSENILDKIVATEEGSKDGKKPEMQEASSSTDRPTKGEPEKKRHRDNSRERSSQDGGDVAPIAKTSLPSAFSNTSSTSPFGGLDTSKESGAKEPTTGASAFAGSSLAAFAGTAKSPFGSLGGSNSVFKSPNPASEPEKKEDKETSTTSQNLGPSPFSSSGPSPFAAPIGGGGFAQSAFASGFASAAPPAGARLTSFASPSVQPPLAKAKAFGSTSDDEDEANEEAEEESPVKGFEGEKMDERFSKQETETGEEDETTSFACRGKLFHFTGKEWKERGVGTFKVNVREDASKDQDEDKPGDEDVEAQAKTTKKSARLIMRNDGVLKVVLNIPLFKGMIVGEDGKEPTGKQLNISGFENGKLVPLLLRAANIDAAKGVYHTIQDLLKQI